MNVRTNDAYSRLVSWFKRRSGIDLALYKEEQMKRRILSFLRQYGVEDPGEAGKAMDRDLAMYTLFLEHITINVTEFYRNPDQWNRLGNDILPELAAGKLGLRCWSAACSSGEEPYTLSMLLAQRLPGTQVSITATDLDETILLKARQAVYPEAALRELPKPLAAAYLERENGGWRVSTKIRSRVSFRRHNLLSDPYETGYDLILCRNVMIYFTEEARRSIYAKFGASLREGGILFVGGTEQIPSPGSYGLEQVDSFFYRKKKGKGGTLHGSTGADS